MAVLFMRSEPGTGRVAKWHTKESRFYEKIKKSGLLTMGVGGQDSNYSNYRSHSSSIVLSI